MSARSVIATLTMPTRSMSTTGSAARTTRTATTPAALFPLAHITHLRRPPKEKEFAIAHGSPTNAAATPILTGPLGHRLNQARKTHFARQFQTPSTLQSRRGVRLGGQPTDSLFQDGLDFRSQISDRYGAGHRPPQATCSAARRSLRWIMNRLNGRKFELLHSDFIALRI